MHLTHLTQNITRTNTHIQILENVYLILMDVKNYIEQGKIKIK